MGKRELKKQYSELDINLIDFISKLDKTKTNKLLPFILKQLRKRLNGDDDNRPKKLYGEWFTKFMEPNNELEYVLLEVILEHFIGKNNSEAIVKFAEHLEEGRIKNNDINQYESWDQIHYAVSEAEIKYHEKELSKQIQRIYEDEDWLLLKPLSLKASMTYGSGTRWCTTMENEPNYFYRYSRNGILIYVINKKSGNKFGFYSSPGEFSVWNSIDQRIDSMETKLPSNLIEIIRDNTDLETNPKNIELFSMEEIEKSESFMTKKDTVLPINGEQGVDEYYVGGGDFMEEIPEEPIGAVVEPMNMYTLNENDIVNDGV